MAYVCTVQKICKKRSYSNKLHSTVTVWSVTKDRILTNILPYIQDNLRERSFLPNSHWWKWQTSVCLLQTETNNGNWLNLVDDFCFKQTCPSMWTAYLRTAWYFRNDFLSQQVKGTATRHWDCLRIILSDWSVSGVELLRVFTYSYAPSIYNKKNYKQAASRKIDRNGQFVQ